MCRNLINLLSACLLWFVVQTPVLGQEPWRSIEEPVGGANNEIPVAEDYASSSLSDPCPKVCLTSQALQQTRWFLGVDGSKQPQDFGVNANLGLRGSVNFGAAIFPEAGIGFQLGSAFVAHGNAVQVFELLGESTDRLQSFTTIGLFQRKSNGFYWGAVYDLLHEESYDQFNLGQWRLKAGLDIRTNTELGATVNLAQRNDQGRFNNVTVELEPIEQLHVFLRQYWESGVSTAVWVGVADGHSEENAVTGARPPKSNQILFGADIYAPLNRWLAIYGETNLVMPADTGAVDAYLGIEFSPGGLARAARGNLFRPMFGVAGNPSFNVDLNRR